MSKFKHQGRREAAWANPSPASTREVLWNGERVVERPNGPATDTGD